MICGMHAQQIGRSKICYRIKDETDVSGISDCAQKLNENDAMPFSRLPGGVSWYLRQGKDNHSCAHLN